MYVAHSEGANFWLNVLTDLQNWGVQISSSPVSTALQASLTPFRACFHRQISSFALCTRYATLLSMLAASIRRSFSRSSNLSMRLRPRKVRSWLSITSRRNGVSNILSSLSHGVTNGITSPAIFSIRLLSVASSTRPTLWKVTIVRFVRLQRPKECSQVMLH